MKAVLFKEYGSPDVLHMGDVPKPVPKDHEVLIKNHASTVTAGDCELRRFDIHILFWLPLRIYLGIFKPRKHILGQEFAGEIVAIGNKVTDYKVGDRVFGGTGVNFGSYAEYRCHNTKYPMTKIPDGMSYETATTIPVGGINSVHFLRKGDIKKGDHVLIYGATGSIGTYALQIAIYYGAKVTAVCGTPNIDLVKSLGADAIIDYMKQDDASNDYVINGEKYDVIFEAVGKSSYDKCIRSLKPKGRLLLTNPKLSEMIRSMWTGIASSKKVTFAFASDTKEILDYVKDLISRSKITSVIGKRYSLENVIEAHKYVEEGKKVGHVVINITS